MTSESKELIRVTVLGTMHPPTGNTSTGFSGAPTAMELTAGTERAEGSLTVVGPTDGIDERLIVKEGPAKALGASVGEAVSHSR